jgi:hypothetical protein
MFFSVQNRIRSPKKEKEDFNVTYPNMNEEAKKKTYTDMAAEYRRSIEKLELRRQELMSQREQIINDRDGTRESRLLAANLTRRLRLLYEERRDLLMRLADVLAYAEMEA